MIVANRFSVLCIALAFLLTSCSGEGTGTGSFPTPSSGVVVDPYISGATFQEILADGSLSQVSSPSDEMGQFNFEEPLSPGSTVVMLDKGMHNGSPYLGTLKALEHHVDDQGRLIISPLTTLLSNYEEIGHTQEEAETAVVNLFSDAGLSLSSADLVTDPMSAANQDGQLKSLQANMSVNAFLLALQHAGYQGFDVEDRANYENDLLRFRQVLTDLASMVLTNLSTTDLMPLKAEIEAMLGDNIPAGYELDLNDLILSLLSSCDYSAEQIANDLIADGVLDVPAGSWVSGMSLKKLVLLNFVSRAIADFDFETFYNNCRSNNPDLPNVISGQLFPADSVPHYWMSTTLASALKPMIRMDNRGNAIAIWEQRNPSDFDIFVSHYSPCLGWGTPELIENVTGSGLNPSIAIDKDGNAMAVWEQADGVRMNIMANYYAVGIGWGAPELIEHNDTSHALKPKVTFDGAGNAIAAWHQMDTTYNIYANRFVKGSGWGEAQLLENESTWGATDAEVIADSNGNAIAVWTQGDGAQNNVMYSRYSANSGWGTAGLVENNPEHAYGPKLAMDAAGNVMVVWYQNVSSVQNVFANRFDIVTGWGGAESIESGSYHATGVRVGMDADGNATAVWYQSDGTRYNILSNRYSIGAGWGTEEIIDSEDRGNAYHPQVAVNAKGDAIAAWQQSNGTRYNLWANRFDANSGWESPKIIDSDDVGDATDASVAIGPLGTGIAVWLQTGGVTASEYR